MQSLPFCFINRAYNLELADTNDRQNCSHFSWPLLMHALYLSCHENLADYHNQIPAQQSHTRAPSPPRAQAVWWTIEISRTSTGSSCSLQIRATQSSAKELGLLKYVTLHTREILHGIPCIPFEYVPFECIYRLNLYVGQIMFCCKTSSSYLASSVDRDKHSALDGISPTLPYPLACYSALSV